MAAHVRVVAGLAEAGGSSWRAPEDPQLFGDLDIDATAMLSYVDELRATTGVRVTVTHLVARAVASVVIGHEVTVRPLLTLTATFDHRYADGSHAARLAETVRYYCADPGGLKMSTVD